MDIETSLISLKRQRTEKPFNIWKTVFLKDSQMYAICILQTALGVWANTYLVLNILQKALVGGCCLEEKNTFSQQRKSC